MADFTIHDETNAPAAARPLLEGAKKTVGFVPNLYGAFAGSPALLEAYLNLAAIINEKSSFTATERQVVRLAASYENSCHYCMAAEAAVSQGAGVDAGVISALREGTPLADAKLEALRRFTVAMVRDRGFVSDADVQTFIEAGYSQEAVLDVVLIVGQKVLSNYTNHLVETPLDPAFAPLAWTKPTVAA